MATNAKSQCMRNAAYGVRVEKGAYSYHAWQDDEAGIVIPVRFVDCQLHATTLSVPGITVANSTLEQ